MATKKKAGKVKEIKKPLKIGIITHAHWVIDFDVHFNHMYVMNNWAKCYDIKMLGMKGLQAADAREKNCETAIEQACTHVLFIDADHIMPVQTLKHLLELQDEAMVSGLVVRRGSPFHQVAYGKNDQKRTYVEIDIPMDGKVYEVGACAFGCTLINLKHLQDLEKPWFRDTCDPGPDGTRRNIRSDINLCDAFRASGKQIWIDTRVLVGHMGQSIIAYPQNAVFLRDIENIYREMTKLREGMVGDYGLTGGRVL